MRSASVTCVCSSRVIEQMPLQMLRSSEASPTPSTFTNELLSFEFARSHPSLLASSQHSWLDRDGSSHNHGAVQSGDTKSLDQGRGLVHL